MATTKKISLLWEDKQITLLEVEKNQPILSHTINLKDAFDNNTDSMAVTEEIQIVALLQKTFRELKIETADVTLALPSRDVILRSFVIPLLKPNEIQFTVQFEAKKYIPFDISELKYTYHTSTILENKVKRIRVLFYAVRKDIIEKYRRILEQTGVKLVNCEPAPVGLCRAMLYQKEINAESRIAVLDINRLGGSIYFIEHGVAVFIREFQLNLPIANVSDESAQEDDVMKMRIFNEIRNSFDFFNRKYAEEIKQLLCYSDEKIGEIVGGFASELNVTVRQYSANLATPSQTYSGINIISGFGVLLAPVNGLAPVANLLTEIKAPTPSMFSALSDIDFDVKEFMPAIQVAIIALLACAGLFAYILSQKQLWKKQVEALTLQEAEFAGSTAEDIQAKTMRLATEQGALKKVHQKSELNIVTAIVAEHVPESMWLTDFDIKFINPEEDKLSLNFTANVSALTMNDQLKIFNEFLSALRADKRLAKYLTKIQLGAFTKQDQEGVAVGSFTVKGN